MNLSPCPLRSQWRDAIYRVCTMERKIFCLNWIFPLHSDTKREREEEVNDESRISRNWINGTANGATA